MPNQIRIKRRSAGGGAGAPASLWQAELAYNEDGQTLWIGEGTGGAGGSATTIVAVGGLGNFVSLTANQTITGTKTFNGTLAATGGTVNVATQANTNSTTLAASTAYVRSVRLDQFAAPTAAVGFGSQLLTGVATPVSGTDAANKNYVDATSTGLDVKASVRLASTANVTVTYNSTNGASGRGQITAAPNTLDGVSLAANDRLLLKDQSTGAQNGIWVVTTLGSGANGVWDRATDFDQDAEVTSGAFVFIEEGTANDNSGFVLATNNPIVIGGASGTALAFNQFSNAGSFVDGNGLVRTGNTLDVVGTAARIVANANSIDIDAAYVGQTSITTLGTIATGTWNATNIAVGKGGTGATAVTGTGNNVLDTSPTLVTPLLGTPTSGVLTNCTGYTVANLAGAGAGVLTFLATASSANLLSALTTKTGTGTVVFDTTPTLTTPALVSETFSTTNNVTAGTNAQNQGALTSDYSVITTAAANPSGATLPTATVGRRVYIVNKGANPVNIYPATGASIDAIAANSPISLVVNGILEFNASSTTQWYSTANAASGVTTFSAGSTGLTPNSGTSGAITLAGTLAVANGGTGVTSSTGTGNVVLSTSPTFTTPLLGTPTSGTLTNCTGYTVANLSGAGAGVLTWLATPTAANLLAATTASTGTGNLVFATSPTFTTPLLGTPTSGTLTNCTGYTVANLSGAGAGVLTWLATPTAANLLSAVTANTGTGNLVFATSPSLTTPALAGETFSTSNAITAGTNAQGQGALTTDYNVVTTASSNPSGVTLPTATQGRFIAVVNKGANPVTVFPASGTSIDALSANAAITLPVNGYLEFRASSTSQWYSSANNSSGVASFSGGSTGLLPSSASTGVVSLSGTLNVSNGGTGVTSSTGSGSVVLSTSPTFTTPLLGTPTSGTLTNCTGYTTANLSGAGAGVLTWLATPTAANLLAAVTANTGTGNLVFATSPTLTTPLLGTPTSGTLTNCTGYTVANLSGAGAGVLTWLATPTAANLLSAVTANTGTGNLVFATSPSLTTPALAGETYSTTNNVTAGTNAQGQGALTTNYNVITTAAANPSGVTLPTATQGRFIAVVNKGANAVNVYPATGGAIDGIASNSPISLAVNAYMEFRASSTTQWYSSFQASVSGTGVTTFSAGTTGLTPNSATSGAISLAGTLVVGNGGTGVATLTGIVKGNGTSAFSAATVDTDYLGPNSPIDGGTF